MDQLQKDKVDKAFTLLNTQDGELDFKIIVSALIV